VRSVTERWLGASCRQRHDFRMALFANYSGRGIQRPAVFRL